MDFIKFYRIKDWVYKNMGIAIIGLLTTGLKPDPIWLIPLLQIFFVQLHSFSMNDYFDYKITREKNYIGSKLKSKFSEKNWTTMDSAPLQFYSRTRIAERS